MRQVLVTVLVWLAMLASIGAAGLIYHGQAAPPVTPARKAGRALLCIGMGLVGARLAYLLITDAHVYIPPITLLALLLIAIGTTCIWADIVQMNGGVR